MYYIERSQIELGEAFWEMMNEDDSAMVDTACILNNILLMRWVYDQHWTYLEYRPYLQLTNHSVE